MVHRFNRFNWVIDPFTWFTSSTGSPGSTGSTGSTSSTGSVGPLQASLVQPVQPGHYPFTRFTSSPGSTNSFAGSLVHRFSHFTCRFTGSPAHCFNQVTLPNTRFIGSLLQQVHWFGSSVHWFTGMSRSLVLSFTGSLAQVHTPVHWFTSSSSPADPLTSPTGSPVYLAHWFTSYRFTG